jgi:hypothetical protein
MEENIPEAPICNIQKIKPDIIINKKTDKTLVIDNGSSFIRAGFSGKIKFLI